MASKLQFACSASTGSGKRGGANFSPFSRRHWPTLREVGLASEKPARWFRGNARDGRRRFVELFEWKDGEASGVAHQSPRVMSIWEPMGALAEGMEFIELERPIE